LAGWKFAAHQLVIVSERQSRESNDPEKAKPDPFRWQLIAER